MNSNEEAQGISIQGGDVQPQEAAAAPLPPIDAKDLDPEFKYKVMEEHGGESLLNCFQCGTCTASCPVNEVDERYAPRRVIHMAVLGMKDEIMTSIATWLCADCHLCVERCPQEVDVSDLMKAIRNIAITEGQGANYVRPQADLLMKHGRLLELDEFNDKLRAKLSLPPIEQRPEGVRKLLERIKLLEILGEPGGGGQ